MRIRAVVFVCRRSIGDSRRLGGHSARWSELAEACGADCDSLYRLLPQHLASIGITAETSPRVFALTELGQPLRRDVPNSAWPGVVFWADLLADSWSYLTECIRTGTTANMVMEGKGIPSRWSQDPDAPAIFRAVMGTAPAENYQPIVVAWNFADSRVVADLGGGGGGLMCAILKTHPNLRGMLVDRQASVDAAVARFDAEGLSNRCKLIGADLAETVPSGADTYVIKHVLHGCRDDAAIRILQNCRQVIPDDGRLLVIEFVLPDVISRADPLLEERLMSDLNMLAVTGGKERSEIEWREPPAICRVFIAAGDPSFRSVSSRHVDHRSGAVSGVIQPTMDCESVKSGTIFLPRYNRANLCLTRSSKRRRNCFLKALRVAEIAGR